MSITQGMSIKQQQQDFDKLIDILLEKLKGNVLYDEFVSLLDQRRINIGSFFLPEFVVARYIEDKNTWQLTFPYSGISDVVTNIHSNMNEFEYVEALFSIHETVRESLMTLYPDSDATYDLMPAKQKLTVFHLKKALEEKSNYSFYIKNSGDLILNGRQIHLRFRDANDNNNEISTIEMSEGRILLLPILTDSSMEETLNYIFEEKKLIDHISNLMLRSIFEPNVINEGEFQLSFNGMISETLYDEEFLDVDFYSIFKKANPKVDLKEIFYLNDFIGEDQYNNAYLKTLHGLYYVKPDKEWSVGFLSFRKFENSDQNINY